MKRRLITASLVMSIMVLAPAGAAHRPIALDMPGAPALVLPPTESGKPLIPPVPQAAPIDPERCVAPLPCGTRLLGTVRKDGAVELQLPALRW